MNTNPFAGYPVILAVALLAACGGGGDSPSPTAQAADEVAACREAVIARGVATDDMLAGASSTLQRDGTAAVVLFHTPYLPSDARYHVFGRCTIESGVIVRIGQ